MIHFAKKLNLEILWRSHCSLAKRCKRTLTEHRLRCSRERATWQGRLTFFPGWISQREDEASHILDTRTKILLTTFSAVSTNKIRWAEWLVYNSTRSVCSWMSKSELRSPSDHLCFFWKRMEAVAWRRLAGGRILRFFGFVRFPFLLLLRKNAAHDFLVRLVGLRYDLHTSCTASPAANPALQCTAWLVSTCIGI